MARGGRHYKPYAPKITRVELSSDHLALRLLGLGIAILVAAGAFAYFINSLLVPDGGWQTLESIGSKSGADSRFVLQYNLGAGQQSVGAEQRKLRAVCAAAFDEAWYALNNEPHEGVVGLYLLNTTPNTPIAVEPVLYAALEQAEASGSRYLYLQPLFQRSVNLYYAGDDEAASLYDPLRSEEAAQYNAQVAAFAADPAQISLRLEDGRAELVVSQAYLDFARENELSGFLGFGCLLDGFIADHVANRLAAEGLTAGTISSFDGYSRALGEGSYGLNLFEGDGSSFRQVASVEYQGPAAAVSFRSFPMTGQDADQFYIYSDGTVRGPYMAMDGSLKCAADNLTLLGKDSCAMLGLTALQVYAADTLDTSILDSQGISWARTVNGTVLTGGTGFTKK